MHKWMSRLAVFALLWCIVSAMADEAVVPAKDLDARDIISRRVAADHVSTIKTPDDFGYSACGVLDYAKQLSSLGMHWFRVGVGAKVEDIAKWSSTNTWPDRNYFEAGGEKASVRAVGGQMVTLVMFSDENGLWAKDKAETYLPQVEEFCYHLGLVYKGGDLTIWEAGNEPDIFWPEMTPKQVAHIALAEARGFHRADPKYLVFSPSPSQSGYMESLLQNGLADGVDGFCIHVYVGGDALRQELATYHNFFKRFNAADKPIFVTETGYCTAVSHATPEKEQDQWYAQLQEQAQQLVERYAVYREAGILKMFWYDATDVGNVYDGENFGLYWSCPYPMRGMGKSGDQWHVDCDHLALKPSAVALRTLGDVLGQLPLTPRRLDLGNGLQAYAFGDGQKRIVLMWSDRDTQLTLPVSGSALAVTSIYGQRSEQPAVNGVTSLSVGHEPVYLGNVDVEALTIKECEVKLADDSSICPGLDVPLKITLSNSTSDRPFDGALTFTASPGIEITPSNLKISLKPGEQLEQTLQVKTVASLPVDTYRLEWRIGRGDGRPDAVRGRDLVAASPLEIKPTIAYSAESKALTCQLEVTNRLALPVSGTFKIAAANGFGAVEQKLEVPPQGKTSIPVPFSDTRVQTPASLQAAFSLDGGPTFNSTPVLKEQPAVYRKDGIAFRGHPEDWADVPTTIHLNGRRFIQPPDRFTTDADLSVDCHALWDEDYLYLGFSVMDDHEVQNQASHMSAWTQDGIQMALDINEQKSAAYDNDDFELIMYRTQQPPTSHIAFTSAPLIGNGVFTAATIQITPIPGGLLYECKMPWTQFGVRAPQAGRKFGFSFLVNDEDGDGKGRKWIEWTPGIGITKVPAQFGDLRLVR